MDVRLTLLGSRMLDHAKAPEFAVSKVWLESAGLVISAWNGLSAWRSCCHQLIQLPYLCDLRIWVACGAAGGAVLLLLK